MPDLTFTGIGSGLQVSEIVTAIVNAEATPYISRTNKQEAEYTTDISAVGALKSALESLSESIEDLADEDNFQLRTASGGDSFVSLTSSEDAVVGSYTVQVDALAAAHKIMSAEFDSDEYVGDGTLTIEVNAVSFDIVVGTADTLSDIRDAINDSDDNESVRATIVTDDDGQHLVLSSLETGTDYAIKTTVANDGDADDTDAAGLSRLVYDTGSAVTHMSEVDAAADAQITIDGTLVVTSSSNVFEEVIDGVDITAKEVHDIADGDDISEISFSENNSNIEAGIEAFVEAYNSLQALSSSLGASSESGAGVLAGDSLLRGVMTSLRQQLSTSYDINDSGDSLSLTELGVTSDLTGVLSFDSDDLDDYISSDIDGVERFFVGSDDDNGFASQIIEDIEYYTESDGIIESRIESRTTQLDKLDDDRLAFQTRMESLEARLYAQYNAMDLIVAGLNSTSSYLMAQLDNMPGVVKSDS